MKTLRDYRVAGALLLGGTGVPATVGDQVTLFLDNDANNAFPVSINGIIQHPINKVECDSYTSYNIEYNEADLLGAALLIRPHDVIDAVLVTQGDILDLLKAPKASPTFTGTVVLPSTTSIGTVSDTEIATLDGVTSAIQPQLNLKAPLASPTFTGTVVLPSTTSIGTVSSTEIGYLDGTTSVVQTQIDLKAPLASPALTGVPTAPTAAAATNTTQLATTEFVTTADALKANLASPTFTGIPAAPTAAALTNTTQLATTAFVTTANTLKADLASPTFTGIPVVPTAAYGTSTTQAASTAFVGALLTSGLAATPQALSGAGAVNVTTLTTAVTSTGVSQALTLADGQNGQIKTIAHDVDGGSAILTPTTKTGFTTITFNNAGETAMLQFFTTRGWMILSLRGAVAA